ncbi:ABC transporter permease [Thalassotalea ganghwensis]
MNFIVKQAISNLKRERSFAISVIFTLALVLGLLVCVATLTHVVLLKPLPYPNAERLYQVQQQQVKHDGEIDNRFYTYPGLLHLYKNQSYFDKAALLYNTEEVITSLDKQPRASFSYATPEWFELFDVPMLHGRPLTEKENLYQYRQSAIISYATWQTLYRGDENILDKSLTVNGKSFSIIGVVAPEFIEPNVYSNGNVTEIWLPFDFHPYAQNEERWGRIIDFRFIGALASPLSKEQIEASLSQSESLVWQENTQDVPFLKGWHIEMKLQPLRTVIIGETESTVLLLMASAVGLVMIAVANLTNLFIAQIAQRRHSLSVFAALGAKRFHLFKGFLVEAGLLMLISLALALVVAEGGFLLLAKYFANELPRLNELRLNTASLVVVLLSLIIFSLLFAVACLKSIDYRQLAISLQASGKGKALQVSRHIRNILIASQVMIATLLLFYSAGLFKQAIDDMSKDIGVELSEVHSLRLTYAAQPIPDRNFFADTMKQLSALLESQPEVNDVSHSSSPLLRFGQWPIYDVDKELRYTTFVKTIDENYFDILSQSLIEGRSFTEEDLESRARVWVVNKQLADHLAPDGNIIGYRVMLGEENIYTIVGVVNNIYQPNQEGTPFRMYMPGRYHPQRLLVKYNANQVFSREVLTPLIQSVDKNMVIYDYHALTDKVDELFKSQRITLYVTALITLFTIVLATLGIYGVLNYASQVRQIEIGTRLAIGAKPKQIFIMLFKENITVIAVGIVGTMLVLAILSLFAINVASMLFSSNALLLFITSVGAIIAMASIGCYLPLLKYVKNPVINSLRGGN